VEGARKFVIDFAGAQLDSLPADKPVEGVVTVGSGAKFLEHRSIRTGSQAAGASYFRFFRMMPILPTKTAQKQRTL